MKVLIITRKYNIWMYMLVYEFDKKGIETFVLNQNTDSSLNFLSWKFIQKRGIIVFLDLFLLQMKGALTRRLYTFLSIFKSPKKNVNHEFTFGLEGFNSDKPSEFKSVLMATQEYVLMNLDQSIFFDVSDVNSDKAISIIKAINPTEIITCGAPILKEYLIKQIPKVFNPHSGIVPYYRGSSPAHWAIYSNDWKNIGYTIHEVTKEIDGGDVLLIKHINLKNKWTLSDIDFYLVYSMYKEIINLIISGDVHSLKRFRPDKFFSTQPPMGFIRNYIANNKLKSYQKKQY